MFSFTPFFSLFSSVFICLLCICCTYSFILFVSSATYSDCRCRRIEFESLFQSIIRVELEHVADTAMVDLNRQYRPLKSEEFGNGESFDLVSSFSFSLSRSFPSHQLDFLPISQKPRLLASTYFSYQPDSAHSSIQSVRTRSNSPSSQTSFRKTMGTDSDLFLEPLPEYLTCQGMLSSLSLYVTERESLTFTPHLLPLASLHECSFRSLLLVSAGSPHL